MTELPDSLRPQVKPRRVRSRGPYGITCGPPHPGTVAADKLTDELRRAQGKPPLIAPRLTIPQDTEVADA